MTSRFNPGVRSQEIRKLLRKRPFRALEVLLDGGEKLIIRHPEAAMMGRDLLVVELPDGFIDYFEARNVSKVRVLTRRVAR